MIEFGFEQRESNRETWFFFPGLPGVCLFAGGIFLASGLIAAVFGSTNMERATVLALTGAVAIFLFRLSRSGVHVSTRGVKIVNRIWTSRVPWPDVDRFQLNGNEVRLIRRNHQSVRWDDSFSFRGPWFTRPAKPDRLDFLVHDLNVVLKRWRPNEGTGTVANEAGGAK